VHGASRTIVKKFKLRKREVVPSISTDADSIIGLAQAGAAAMEYEFAVPEGKLVAVSIGPVLRASVE
jgi:DNA-binding transcriptional regulator LsrR (DeoR family)